MRFTMPKRQDSKENISAAVLLGDRAARHTEAGFTPDGIRSIRAECAKCQLGRFTNLSVEH